MKKENLKLVLVSAIPIDRLYVVSSGSETNIVKILTSKAKKAYSIMKGVEEDSISFITRHDPVLIEIIENLGDEAVKYGYHVFIHNWIETFKYTICKLVECNGKSLSWTEVVVSPETINSSWIDVRKDDFSKKQPLCHFSEIKNF